MSSLAPNGAASSPTPSKKRRNLPGNPDPDAEVIALSPNGLMAKNRFMCEICNKGFQRDQNLQLHRRGHNLPWKLKQRPKDEATRKKVYICPEASCVHHSPSRALGDLTGIKKHFSRKHGEKKYRCDKCSKKYAVQCDWKAHSKTCGTRDYRCDCGTIFSRRDSFITHRAFCDALSEENARPISLNPIIPDDPHPLLFSSSDDFFSFKNEQQQQQQQQQHCNLLMRPSESQPWSTVFDNKSSAALISHEGPTLHPLHHLPLPSSISPHLSATALLQKAAEMGSTTSSRRTASTTNSGMFGAGITSASAPSPLLLPEMLMMSSASGFAAGSSFDAEDSSNKSSSTTMEAAMIKKNNEGMTRDFLGLEGPSLSHNDILFSMHSQQNERS